MTLLPVEFAYIEPDWPAPDSVRAVITSRQGGGSKAPWGSLNLALHVGDCEQDVMQNRARLGRCTAGKNIFQWLNQTHGTDVVAAAADNIVRDADACFTHEKNLVCAVLTADCLPVLFCNRQGSQVAACHAGWRGLGAGILENTVASFSVPPRDVMAWLGPAIGPDHFEVGSDVRKLMCERYPFMRESEVFTKSVNGQPSRWLMDLYLAAELVLRRAGVSAVFGGGACTYCDDAQFYSYRRDGLTGRFVSCIWLDETS